MTAAAAVAQPLGFYLHALWLPGEVK